jgi:hypothetical protein
MWEKTHTRLTARRMAGPLTTKGERRFYTSKKAVLPFSSRIVSMLFS